MRPLWITAALAAALQLLVLPGALYAQAPAATPYTGFDRSSADPRWKSLPPSKLIKPLAKEVTAYTEYPGFIPMYFDPGSGRVRARLAERHLDTDILYFPYVESGVAALGSFRGGYLDSRVLRLRRVYNRIEVVAINTRYYYDPASALSHARGANVSDSILAVLPIELEDKASGDVLVDWTDVLGSEQLYPLRPPKKDLEKAGVTLGSVAGPASKVIGLHNYPQNSDVVVEYSYSQAEPGEGKLHDVADSRAISVQLRHIFAQAPAGDYAPRRADHRVGYFQTIGADMTLPDSHNWRDFIHRWDLRAAEGAAAVTQPIVWWIGRTTPPEIRPTIMRAALRWNRAFEALGYPGALTVQVQPDDASWDAGDLRYNVIQWVSSPRPGFGGYGPVFVDPRSGQIMGADITLEFSFLYQRREFHDLVSELGPAQPAPHAGCEAGAALSREMALAMMSASGLSYPVEGTAIVVDAALESALHYLTLHELGHTLGLTHNFKGSLLRTMQELADPAVPEATAASVMDYPAANITAKYGIRAQRLFPRDIGPYDLWAIEYGYSAPATQGESSRLAAIADRSGRRELAYANDADDMRKTGENMDPYAMLFDFSADPVLWQRDRQSLLERLALAMPRLYRQQGRSSEDYVRSLDLIYRAWMLAYESQGRFVGGVEQRRVSGAQQALTAPLQALDPELQRQVLADVLETARAGYWDSAVQQLMPYSSYERRGFNQGGGQNYAQRSAYIEGPAAVILGHLLHPVVLRRLHDWSPAGVPAPAEIMDSLAQAWIIDLRPRRTTVAQLAAQTKLVEALIQLMQSPEALPALRAQARATLQSVLPYFAGSTWGSSEVSAQHAWLRTRIEDALGYAR